MITNNKLFLYMSISYFIGVGIGYILKLDITSILSTRIIAVFLGLGFSTYVVAIIFDIKEK